VVEGTTSKVTCSSEASLGGSGLEIVRDLASLEHTGDGGNGTCVVESTTSETACTSEASLGSTGLELGIIDLGLPSELLFGLLLGDRCSESGGNDEGGNKDGLGNVNHFVVSKKVVVWGELNEG